MPKTPTKAGEAARVSRDNTIKEDPHLGPSAMPFPLNLQLSPLYHAVNGGMVHLQNLRCIDLAQSLNHHDASR